MSDVIHTGHVGIKPVLSPVCRDQHFVAHSRVRQCLVTLIGIDARARHVINFLFAWHTVGDAHDRGITRLSTITDLMRDP